MFYELRLYTPHKGKMDEYAELFHKLPEKIYEQAGASVVAMWETQDEAQPAFAYLISFQDRAHREEFRANVSKNPLMKEYSPQRAQLIDSNVPAKNLLLKPVKHSKLK